MLRGEPLIPLSDVSFAEAAGRSNGTGHERERCRTKRACDADTEASRGRALAVRRLGGDLDLGAATLAKEPGQQHDDAEDDEPTGEQRVGTLDAHAREPDEQLEERAEPEEQRESR